MGQDVQTGDITYFIAGPTACGKTQMAVELAELIDGEVVSADSAQIYKHMDIGSAKPTTEEMRGIRHHLIGVLEPDVDCSAAMFQKMAFAALEDIKSRGKKPIIAGGSGFYLNSLLYNVEFAEGGPNISTREKYMQIAKLYGNMYLHGLLRGRDPGSAEPIHPNNVKRVARALAFNDETGAKLSAHNARESQKPALAAARLFILNMDRPLLYERINARVDLMFERGLVNEVQNLMNMGYGEKLASMQALGYKETIAYLKGRCTLGEAKETIKRATRRFAKRQLTWFKHKCDGLWVSAAGLRAADLIMLANDDIFHVRTQTRGALKQGVPER